MRGTILLLLLACVTPPVFGMEQHATICKFELQPSKAISGAACYDFTGTICFEYSMDDFKKAGDSLEKTYVLNIKFKEGLQQVTANVGFNKHYCDEAGILALSNEQKLSLSDVYNYDFTFSVPVSAFNLSAGQHTLTPLISLADEQSAHSILHKGKTAPVTITVLPIEKIRIWVKYILVDSLDANGRLWDYFVFNPIESNPDIVWHLDYAGQTYFSSKIRRNVFKYFDEQQHETFDLTISKEDTLNIQVRDIDDLTPDDIIGNILVATSNPANKNGAIVAAKADQIKSLQYSITVLK